jgi:hypothetical protein
MASSYGQKSLAQKIVGDLPFAIMRDAEHTAIRARRAAQSPPRAAIAQVHLADNDSPSSNGPVVYNLSGLALSGGGVRSAAFCLGALQALDEYFGVRRIDYLSTVSGGGYMGSAVTASMAKTGKFLFGAPQDRSDPAAVGHLRNYSNYLLPRGESLSFLRGLSVVLRGLVANAILVLVPMLAAAVLMICAYPKRSVLTHGNIVTRLADPGLWPRPFAVTGWLLLFIAIFFVIWAVWRSFFTARGCDVRGKAVDFLAYSLLALIAVVFIELQPLTIAGLFALCDNVNASASFYGWAKSITATLAPLGAGAALFANRLSGFLKSTQRSRGAGIVTARLAASAAIVGGALALPLALWASFLCLCFVGIGDDKTNAMVYPFGLVAPDGSINLFGHPLSIVTFYLGALGLALFVAALFKPNANSLHRLYRDRLSKAFLFNPDPTPPLLPTVASHPSLVQRAINFIASLSPSEDTTTADGDFPQLDPFPLSDMSPPTGGPYHLINAALNIQASKTANRRGRNADFFLFTSNFVGSDSTGYVRSDVMQSIDRQLDLATAMAISGAAASSDMGSKSIRLLAPTLALLNIRLGYWLRNPNSILRSDPNSPGERRSWLDALHDVGKLYLLWEMLGQLTEKQRHIYLTDGGHLENLGLYQLLKRGCKFIVVVDAEADPDMEFPAFVTLERYARIDLGVRIDLPWQQIAQTSLAVDAAVDKEEAIKSTSGPHCALGVIHYPDGVDGHLLYVKASLSGDEHDYVLDYKRRYPSFPHETTSDQFFTEEQFEVYRALAFHVVGNALSGTDQIAWTPETGCASARNMLDQFRSDFG